MPHPGLLTQSPAPSEFQRIAKTAKKAFLSEKCKGIEKKNRIGKTRDLFKRIRDTKGKFHAKMGTIKDRNYRVSLVAQRLKCLPPLRETWVQSLCWEDPLEKEMATQSSILAWRIPWTEEPGRLQSMWSQRVGHD